MPELPEVEALRRGLVKSVVGSIVLKVQVLKEKLVSGKGTKRQASKEKTLEFIKGIKNKKILSIKRRAKNLIFELDTGIILVHLKMTGQMVFVPKNHSTQFSGGHPMQESEGKLPHKHTYIIFHLDNGTLYYNDVRQFGYVLYYKSEAHLDSEKHFENIGIEPFDENFTLEYFKEKIKQKVKKSKNANSQSLAIKKVLLEQEIVVGCGNIYCDEVLWSSSVLPTRSLKSLKVNEIERMYENIKIILDKAINSGGSSIANYLLVDGSRGNYADYHNVYQKTGTQCKFTKCKGIIEKIVLSGRGTHFCPVHQK
jgi:formamidopyrimidine-DNA glycosylase